MITSRQNPQVKRVRTLMSDAHARRDQRLLPLEGVRLVSDALDSGAALELAFFDPGQLQATAAGRALLERLVPYRMASPASSQVLAAMSETVSPQGVVALVRWPQVPPGPPGLILVLDAVQDPGNLGTLLRSAEAVGAERVLVMPGSADPTGPKVIRAAMGAHFRLCVDVEPGWETTGERLHGRPVYAAAPQGRLQYDAVDWRQPAALIIGNEAHGVGPQAQARATAQIAIPMVGRAESLNAAVAGSIIMFEALRQRRTA